MASVKCPFCGTSLRTENLPKHLASVHPGQASSADTKKADRDARRVARDRPSRPRSSFRGVWRPAAVVVVIALAAAGLYMVVSAAEYAERQRLLNDPVETICLSTEGQVMHIHPYLTINIDGTPYTIPADIGTKPCLRMIHTHDTTGRIHVESPVVRTFRLSDFFAVWGETFTSTQILSYNTGTTHVIEMTLDGAPNTEYGDLVLKDAQQIVINFKSL